MPPPRINNNFSSFCVPLSKESLPSILGVTLAVAGLFLILSKSVTIPQKVNAMVPRMGNYLVGALLMGGGAITSVLGVMHTYKIKDALILDTATASLKAYKSPDSRRSVGVQLHHPSDPSDPNSAFATSFVFFFLRCDGIDDKGWGCAWRSIQICASACGHFPTFGYLYKTYRTNTGNPKWAEPGFGQRYLNDVGVKSQIVLYNREEGTEKTAVTKECPKIWGFHNLRNKILEHFKTQNTPIMADDVSYALTIVGIQLVGDNTILFIADPHKIDAKNGLYWVELDKNGKQLRTSGKDYEDQRNGLGTVKTVFFNNDKKNGWLLLFPEPHQPETTLGPRPYDL